MGNSIKTCTTKETTTSMTENNSKNTPKKTLSTTQLCIFILILGSISSGLIYLSIQADKHIKAAQNPNKNPLMHKTELKQVLKMHAMLDKDKNGVISRDEVAFLADKIQAHPSNPDEEPIPKEKQIDFLIKAADLNEDGVINVAEFEKMWERHEKTRIAREKFNENKDKAK